MACNYLKNDVQNVTLTQFNMKSISMFGLITRKPKVDAYASTIQSHLYKEPGEEKEP